MPRPRRVLAELPEGDALALFAAPTVTLDLANRWTEVRRMARSHRSLYAAALRAGWDAEDLDQEILARVVARAHRFDPRRGSWSKFVWLLTRSVTLNLLSRAKARREDVVAEPESWDPADQREDSAAPLASLVAYLDDLVLAGEAAPELPRLAELLAEGRPRHEAARELGLDAARARALLVELREVAGEHLSGR
jgi:DNA-directed RNA polymerase specialized sigma24 family protein